MPGKGGCPVKGDKKSFKGKKYVAVVTSSDRDTVVRAAWEAAFSKVTEKKVGKVTYFTVWSRIPEKKGK